MYFTIMFTLTWPHCIGQSRIKEVLEAAIANRSLGHAYLFSGDEGAGKFAAALDVTLSLLCESTAKRPCLACPSCKKVMEYSHPDFHLIMPVILGTEHKSDGDLNAKGWAVIAERAKERIRDPYSAADRSKAPSIPVDWIREVTHTIRGGSYSGGVNVAILDCVDSLKAESANSMLKILEEPPPGTVLLLLTDRISEVLPTIVSRCQIVRFAWLSPDEIRAELVCRFGEEAASADGGITDTGSLGKSLELYRNPAAGVIADAAAFLDLCGEGSWMEIAKRIDDMADWKDLARYEKFFAVIMDLVREAFLQELPASGNVFLAKPVWRAKKSLTNAQVAATLEICGRSIAAVRGYAGILLVLSNSAIALAEVFGGKKQ